MYEREKLELEGWRNVSGRGEEKTFGQTFSKTTQILRRDCHIREVTRDAGPAGGARKGRSHVRVLMSVVRPAGITQRRETERCDDSM
jgi:hypothetical protein